MSIRVRNYRPDDGPAIVALQQAHAALHPAVSVVPAEVYSSPSFEGGRNVWCAEDDGGVVLGYAALFPQLVQAADSPLSGGLPAGEEASLPHRLWANITTDPRLDDGGPCSEALMAQVRRRGREIKEAVQPATPAAPRAWRMAFQLHPSEMERIAHVQAQGADHQENIYTMRRDLAEPVSDWPCPHGLSVRPWRMESEAEQRAYLAAKNECFPEGPTTLADWQYFQSSPMWAVGTTFTAFDGDALAGSVLVYWDPRARGPGEPGLGYTEEIFVRPPWRRRGVARHLIVHGLRHLQAHGLREAGLEVRARNEEALPLYRSLGYQVRHQTGLYVLSTF